MSNQDRKFKRQVAREGAKSRELFVTALIELPFKVRAKLAWKILIGERF
jgi:hypothetical protein